MKYFKIFILSMISLMSLILILLVTLWFNLGVLFTPSNLEWAQKKFSPEADFSWSLIKTDVVNAGLFEKVLNLKSSELCIDYKNSNACFKKIDLSLSINFLMPYKFKFLKFIALSSRSDLKVSDFMTSVESDRPFNSIHSNTIAALDYKRKASEKLPEAFVFEAENVNIEKNNESFAAGLRIEKTGGAFFISKGSELKAEAFYSIGENILLRFLYSDKLSAVKLSSKGTVTDKIRLDTRFSYSTKTKESLKDKTSSSLNFSNEIYINEKELGLIFKDIEVFGLQYFSSVRMKTINFKFKDSGASDFFIKDLNLILDSDKIMSENKVNKRIFDNSYIFNIDGKLYEEALLSDESALAVSSKIVLKPIKNELISAAGDFKLELFKTDESFIFNPEEFKFRVEVSSFKSLVDDLEGSIIAVPAPINRFDGTLYFETKKALAKNKMICFPLSGAVDLSAPSSSDLDLNLEGDFCWPRNKENKVFVFKKSDMYSKPSLNLDIFLEHFNLTLPDLDPIRGVPNFTKDSRIVLKQTKDSSRSNELNKTKKEKKNAQNFNYNLSIKSKSKNDSPIQINYKYFKPYLPAQISAEISNDKSSYNFTTSKSWKIEYLDRELTVNKMNISQTMKKPDDINIDVSFLYETSIYKIFIDIGGTIDDPFVKFSSSPFLSRSDIISVLLYNRTSSELSQFESESVGSAEAAVSDRAIGLFGIWAFASTPIETVSYDSSSGVYAAQIGLPGGLKFSVGTDWESVQNLGLRKRISESWLIVTSFDPGGADESVGNIFLRREWVY